MINAIIVDDEDLIRQGLKILVDWEKLGVSITAEAANGLDALKIIREEQPHMAIVDVKMPALNGVELIEEVRKSGLNTLFVILSGYDNFAFAQQAVKLGAFRYLLKPIEAEELEECICEAVKKIKQQNKEEGIMNKCRFILGERTFERLENSRDLSEDPGNESTSKSSSVRKTVQYINEHVEERLSLDDLAKLVFMHPSYLSQVFKNEMGENLVDYIIRIRVERAKELFKNDDLKLYEVAEKVGYKDFRYFGQLFKKLTGFLPSEYKKMARSEQQPPY